LLAQKKFGVSISRIQAQFVDVMRFEKLNTSLGNILKIEKPFDFIVGFIE
jgi:hypothetical protein